ncbi:MAG: hypothetical protein MR006_01090 [Arcanobacterium sp.]|nr:hypothetical protein [Arcanobacterium sp.]MDY5589579.1 hypothetical protein [Arcanobacterium sp.]
MVVLVFLFKQRQKWAEQRWIWSVGASVARVQYPKRLSEAGAATSTVEGAGASSAFAFA